MLSWAVSIPVKFHTDLSKYIEVMATSCIVVKRQPSPHSQGNVILRGQGLMSCLSRFELDMVNTLGATLKHVISCHQRGVL